MTTGRPCAHLVAERRRAGAGAQLMSGGGALARGRDLGKVRDVGVVIQRLPVAQL